jgi:hypothetical protein
MQNSRVIPFLCPGAAAAASPCTAALRRSAGNGGWRRRCGSASRCSWRCSFSYGRAPRRLIEDGGRRQRGSMAGGGAARVRGRFGRAAFIGAGGCLAVARTPRQGLAAAQVCPSCTPRLWRPWPGTLGPDGPRAGLRRAKGRWVGPSGSAQ